MRRKFVLLSAVIAMAMSAVAPETAKGKFLVQQYQTLAGVRNFNLVIEQLNHHAAWAGLSAETLRVFVEAELRRSKLPLVDSPTTEGYLYVNVTVVCNPRTEGCAANTSVQFFQDVALRGNTISSATWTKFTTALITKGSLRTAVAVQLREQLLPYFFVDYLKANRNKQGPN